MIMYKLILLLIVSLLLVIKNKKISIISIIIIFILFYTFRIITSIDDKGYQEIFDLIKLGYKTDFVEKTFRYIVEINLMFSNKITITYFIYSLISFIFIFKIITIIYPEKIDILIFLTYFILFLLVPTITLMRQFISITIVSYAFIISKNRVKFKSIILIVLASLFHNSAIIMIPVLWIIRIKIKPTILIFILIGGVFLGLVGAPNIVINIFVRLGFYTEYSPDTSVDIYNYGLLTTSLLILGITNLILQIKYPRVKDENEYAYTNLWVLYLFTFAIFTNSGWASRLSLYFSLFIPIIFLQIKSRIKIK